MGKRYLISITLATKDYIPQILEIENEAISPPWTHGYLLSEINKDDSHFIVAVKEKKTDEPSPCLVGFAILRQVGDDGELLQIAVDKSVQRSGVGDLLMERVLAYAEENSFESVFLEVRESNEAAVRLYEKHGFRTVRVRKSYYDSPVEDALVMSSRKVVC